MKKITHNNINLISGDRHCRGTSQLAQWVRENYSGKYIVSVKSDDSWLDSRGYEFTDRTSFAAMFAGKNRWFKAFDSEENADAEIDIIGV